MPRASVKAMRFGNCFKTNKRQVWLPLSLEMQSRAVIYILDVWHPKANMMDFRAEE